jgi:hypothetical protein
VEHLSSEAETLRATAEIVPDQIVASLASYIRYGGVEGLPSFVPLAQEAWEKVAREVTDYTAELQRILSTEERVELFVRASQLAFEIHQQDRLPNSSELLTIPSKFINPRIVSDEGWQHIQRYYEPRPFAGGPYAA